MLLNFLFLSAVNLSAQTPCGDMGSQPGKWVKTPPTGKDRQSVQNINTAMTLFQQSVAGFTGGQAKTYTFTADWVNVSSGRFQGYTVAMYFLQYECVYGKMKPEAATGTWLYIGFNEIPFFTSNNNAGEDFRLPNGQQMFYSQYKSQGNFKGLTKLAPLHHTNAEAVFISDKNRLPFRAVTQAEFLSAYKNFFIKKKDAYMKGLEDHIAREPADLARIENDRQMAGREESKKALLESNNRTRAYIAQYKQERAACVARLDLALMKPSARQPAVVEFIDEYCQPEKMFLNPTNERARQIVVFDEAYFDKSLSSATPQFIVVYWRREDEARFPVKRKFLHSFMENFDFTVLQNMLDK